MSDDLLHEHLPLVRPVPGTNQEHPHPEAIEPGLVGVVAGGAREHVTGMHW